MQQESAREQEQTEEMILYRTSLPTRDINRFQILHFLATNYEDAERYAEWKSKNHSLEEPLDFTQVGTCNITDQNMTLALEFHKNEGKEDLIVLLETGAVISISDLTTIRTRTPGP